MLSSELLCCTKIESTIYKKLGSLLKYCTTCYNIFKNYSKFVNSSDNHFFIRENEEILLNCTICHKKLYKLQKYKNCEYCTAAIEYLENSNETTDPYKYYCCRSIVKNYYKGYITELETCPHCYVNYYIFDDTTFLTNPDHFLVRGNTSSHRHCTFCYTPFYKLIDVSKCTECLTKSILDPLPLDLSIDKSTKNFNITVNLLVNV